MTATNVWKETYNVLHVRLLLPVASNRNEDSNRIAENLLAQKANDTGEF